MNDCASKACFEPSRPRCCIRSVAPKVVFGAIVGFRPQQCFPLQNVADIEMLMLLIRSPNIPAALPGPPNHGATVNDIFRAGKQKRTAGFCVH